MFNSISVMKSNTSNTLTLTTIIYRVMKIIKSNKVIDNSYLLMYEIQTRKDEIELA